MGTTLNLLKQMAHGVATQFGESCEIVIHDLKRKKIDSSIVYIEHGQVSRRTIGDGPSPIVLEAMQSDDVRHKLKDKLAYITNTEDGRVLKSSTMFIRDDEDKINYIFSLNYDITGLITMTNALKDLTSVPSDTSSKPTKITHKVNDLLDSLIEQSVSLVGKPVALMNKDDKVRAIRFLNDAGAFLITKSGDKVSSYFGISKFTMYSYMDVNMNK